VIAGASPTITAAHHQPHTRILPRAIAHAGSALPLTAHAAAMPREQSQPARMPARAVAAGISAHIPIFSASQTSAQDPLLGGQGTFAISYSNAAGGDYGYDLTVVDTLPPGLTYTGATDRSAVDATPQAVSPNTINTVTLPSGLTQQTLTFINLHDLAPNQSGTLQISGQLAGSVALGTVLTNTASLTLNDDPRGAGNVHSANPPPAAAIVRAIREIVTPIGTCGGQLTGHDAYPYQYRLTTQNNVITPTDNLVLTAVLPDGVHYRDTQASSLQPASVTTNSAGQTTLVYDVGTLQANASQDIIVDADIGYTDTASTAAVIQDDTVLTTNASLAGTLRFPPFVGTAVTATGQGSVTAKFTTICKSVNTAALATGQTLTYTISGAVSQYYDASNVVVVDTLPDGQDYVANTLTLNGGALSSNQYTVVSNADGTTTITVPINTDGATTTATHSYSLQLQATVDTYYTHNLDTTQPIVAGDRMANGVTVSYHAQSIAGESPANSDDSTDAGAAGGSIPLPSFAKALLSINGTAVGPTPEGAIGDVVRYSLTFTGITQADMQDIRVYDYLPLDVDLAASPNFSYGGTYTGPAPEVDVAPHGIAWTLGSGSPMIFPRGDTWTVSFDTVIVSGSHGDILRNLGKYSGQDHLGIAYSGLDEKDLTVIGPQLSINKTSTPPAGSTISAGQTITYAVQVTNTGTSTAYTPVITDTIPLGMRQTAPQFLSAGVYNGSTLISDLTSTAAPTYTAATGQLLWNFPPSVSFDPGQNLTVVYKATIDPTLSPLPAAGMAFTNQVVATATSQPPLSPIFETVTASGSESVYEPTISVGKAEASAISPNGYGVPGEQLTYTVTFTVPAQTTNTNASLVDSLPVGEVLDTSDGSDVATLALPVPATNGPPLVAGGGTSPTTLTWNFGTITNAGTTPLSFTIIYKAHLAAVSPGSGAVFAGAHLTNRAILTWQSDPAYASGTLTASASSTVTVKEPRLVLIKIPTHADTTSAFFTIGGTVSLANAADLSIADALPVGATYTGSSVPPASNTTTGGVTTLVFNVGSVAIGQSVPPITIYVTISAAGPDPLINTATATYYSLPAGAALGGDRRSYTATAYGVFNQAAGGLVLPPGTPYTSYPPQQLNPNPSGSCSAYVVVAGALPPGLSLDPSTGIVSGTPTQGGSYSFDVECTIDATHTATRLFTIPIPGGRPCQLEVLPNPETIQQGGSETILYKALPFTTITTQIDAGGAYPLIAKLLRGPYTSPEPTIPPIAVNGNVYTFQFTTGADGRASLDFDVPASAAIGVHTVTTSANMVGCTAEPGSPSITNLVAHFNVEAPSTSTYGLVVLAARPIVLIRSVEPATHADATAYENVYIHTVPGATVTLNAEIFGKTTASLGSATDLTSGELTPAGYAHGAPFSDGDIFFTKTVTTPHTGTSGDGRVTITIPLAAQLLTPNRTGNIKLFVTATTSTNPSYKPLTYASGAITVKEVRLRLIVVPHETTRGDKAPVFELGHLKANTAQNNPSNNPHFNTALFSALVLADQGAHVTGTVTFGDPAHGGFTDTENGTAGALGGRVTLKFHVPDGVAPASGLATLSVTSSFRGSSITRSVVFNYGPRP
jgi:uncharacterized repeat protein (TIGR01451 family)